MPYRYVNSRSSLQSEIAEASLGMSCTTLWPALKRSLYLLTTTKTRRQSRSGIRVFCESMAENQVLFKNTFKKYATMKVE